MDRPIILEKELIEPWIIGYIGRNVIYKSNEKGKYLCELHLSKFIKKYPEKSEEATWYIYAIKKGYFSKNDTVDK